MLDIHGQQPAQEASLEVQSSSDFLQGKLSKPCEQCGQPLKSRKHGGGSPQRFCSQECRTAWHSAQRNPACTLESAIVDPPPKKPQTDSPAATPEASEDFDWSNTNSVVLEQQPRTAVYWNPVGQLVIRQYDWPDEDSCIVISKTSLDEFLDKLTEICGIPSFRAP
jgi:hypothetical protein